jgi:hypothetical protein
MNKRNAHRILVEKPLEKDNVEEEGDVRITLR